MTDGIPSKIVALGNISVSEVDGTIYIANTNLVSPGVPGTLAVYANNQGALESAGNELCWDALSSTLSCKFIATNNISLITNNKTQSSFEIWTEEWQPGLERLIISTKSSKDQEYAVTLDHQHRLKLRGRLNLKPTLKPIKAIGSVGDQKGDMAVDEYYIYYCRRDYNGKYNIWSRWAVTELDW